MEYVYAAMLLHSAKQEVKEDSVKKVLDAAGVKADTSKIKALVASLKDVNIEEAIKAAVVAPAAATAAPASGGEAKAEAKPVEEEGKSEEEAAEGLAGLFG